MGRLANGRYAAEVVNSVIVTFCLGWPSSPLSVPFPATRSMTFRPEVTCPKTE